MRCFIAVDVPKNLKEKIVQVQEELSGLDTKLVEKENLHFTLKFLGEVSFDKISVVKERLKAVKSEPMNVHLNGVGFFPSSSFIRVVWIGANSKEFINLHVAVNEALQGMFAKEESVPHLTLARVRSQLHKKDLIDFSKKHQDEDFGSFEVRQIKLKESKLSRNGPVYDDVEAFDLC